MTPMPEAATPVYEAIKKLVKRPDVLPELLFIEGGGVLFSILRWHPRYAMNSVYSCCPMGMLPSALVASPTSPNTLSGYSQEEISAYGSWFDSLTEADIPEFMDFQWPEVGANANS